VRFTAKHSSFFDVEVEFEVTGDRVPPITSGPAGKWDPGDYEEDGREITCVSIGRKDLPKELVELLKPFLQPCVDAVHPSHFKIK